MRSLAALALVPALILAPRSVAAQVAADVVIGTGPVAGRVVVGRPSPEVVVVDRGRRHYHREYAPRVIVVERYHRGPRGVAHGYWRNRGWRPVTLYYIDGRFYDRPWRGARYVSEVVVYERGGRYLVPRDFRYDSGEWRRGYYDHWEDRYDRREDYRDRREVYYDRRERDRDRYDRDDD
ncbi:MAG TPA: hypothetical protein VJ773_01980 [Gemmatimonadales bacterium]|nr:hypothetical protein [Gemmatimonadales bacterium]